MSINKLRLGLQYFAEPEQTPPLESTVALTELPEPQSTPPAKSYTAEEVDKLINERLTSVTQSVDSKLSEAQKLAEMSADEQEKYKAEQREELLSARENEITKRELMSTAKDTLISKAVPSELAGLLDYSNAENCTKSIEMLEKAFKSAVAQGVNEAIKGITPKAPINSNIPSATLRVAMGLPAETKLS